MKRDIKYIMTVSAVMLILQGCGGDSVTSTHTPETKTIESDAEIDEIISSEETIVLSTQEGVQNDTSEFIIPKDDEKIDIQDNDNISKTELPDGITIPNEDEEIILLD